MDNEIDLSLSYESDIEVRNPEKNFISTKHRLKFGSDSSNDSENENRREKLPDKQAQQNTKEKEYWKCRRHEREKLAEREIRGVWGKSPSHMELEQVYMEEERSSNGNNAGKNGNGTQVKKHKRKKTRSVSSSSSSSDHSSSAVSDDSDSRKHAKRSGGKKSKKKKEKKRWHSSSKKHKKEKKSKKSKKCKRDLTSESCNESGTDEASDNSSHKRKKRVKNDEKSNGPQVRQDGWLIKKKKSGMEEKEEEWVELTKELREEEAERTKQEEAQIIGPQIPDYLLQKTDANIYEGKVDARNQKNMLKGEAAAMAAYVSQGKRIPRRGEIGLSSSEISEFEKVGYVMSGTRHKSMEATRLRKEDQILTAEEKRLLSNFSVEQRRNREDTVLNQFRDLIASKKSKN